MAQGGVRTCGRPYIRDRFLVVSVVSVHTLGNRSTKYSTVLSECIASACTDYCVLSTETLTEYTAARRLECR